MSRRKAKAQHVVAPGARRWLPAIAGAVLVIAATPSAVLIAVLLLPTLMAAVADTQPGRPGARAVLLFGLAAACAPLSLLWQGGQQMQTSLNLAFDVPVIATAWSAQAAGWLLSQCLPILIDLVLEARAQNQKRRLLLSRAALEAEWTEAQPGADGSFTS